MTDRELLEAAARAAGYLVRRNSEAVDADDNFRGIFVRRSVRERYELWNPLAMYGQALWLAVLLRIDIEMGRCYCETTWIDESLSATHRFMQDWGAGPTRMDVRMDHVCLAIVRAAAEASKHGTP